MDLCFCNKILNIMCSRMEKKAIAGETETIATPSTMTLWIIAAKRWKRIFGTKRGTPTTTTLIDWSFRFFRYYFVFGTAELYGGWIWKDVWSHIWNFENRDRYSNFFLNFSVYSHFPSSQYFILFYFFFIVRFFYSTLYHNITIWVFFCRFPILSFIAILNILIMFQM